MGKVEELLAAGRLQPAIDEITGEVKANPTDANRRTFLFELLCFAGDWDRAERQLDIIGEQSPKAAVGAEVYRNNIRAERARTRLFSDGLRPHFLFDPPPYVNSHLEAICQIAEGQFERARELLDRAERQRAALQGKLNDKDFLDFRDYDDVVAPVLELIAGDQYLWLPFEQIKELQIPKPSRLRDLIWPEAKLVTNEGSLGEVFLLALYHGSPVAVDDRVKLGRMTEWSTLGDRLYSGAGLRLFLVDDQDRPIFEANKIEFCNNDFTGTALPM